MKRLLTATIALAAAFAAKGDEWYVDPVNGLDTRDGTTSNVVSATVGPRKTLEYAMKLVNAGDTLWLLPGEYNEGSMRSGRTRLYVSQDNVKIKSTAGAANTFIVGEGGTDNFEHIRKELRSGRQRDYRRNIRGPNVQGRLRTEAS